VLLVAAASRKLADAVLSITCSHVGFPLRGAQTHTCQRSNIMELHQLRYFCAVAHNGNVTRAAKTENVAQPSLPQQILKLEAELGAKLFDRFSRSARLTQLGRTLLLRAEAILRQVGEARTEIQEMAGAEKRRVVIGAMISCEYVAVSLGAPLPRV
jgi:hypothetical protein